LNRTQAFIKRSLDLLVAATAIIVLFPVLVGIGLFIIVRDGGPVIYSEPRCGRKQQAFLAYKFRSLKVTPSGSSVGCSVATGDDPRLTRSGAILRQRHLDELPQLWNILKGDMSLVGPRPMKPEHANTLSASTRSLLYWVKPGLTGPDALDFIAEDAALTGYPDAESLYIKYILPAKAGTITAYIEHYTLAADCRLILQTIRAIFSASVYQASCDRIRALLPD
jgi:lipopolysaccharide/colanic/teichoic acid biosynthesis glycosyltransferase